MIWLLGAKHSSHKTHNAFGKYPTMHHFVTKICTIFCYKMLHYGYDTGASLDLCNCSLVEDLIWFVFLYHTLW